MQKRKLDKNKRRSKSVEMKTYLIRTITIETAIWIHPTPCCYQWSIKIAFAFVSKRTRSVSRGRFIVLDMLNNKDDWICFGLLWEDEEEIRHVNTIHPLDPVAHASNLIGKIRFNWGRRRSRGKSNFYYSGGDKDASIRHIPTPVPTY